MECDREQDETQNSKTKEYKTHLNLFIAFSLPAITVYSKVQPVYFQAYKLQPEIFSLQLQSLSLAAKIKLEIYVLIIL